MMSGAEESAKLRLDEGDLSDTIDTKSSAGSPLDIAAVLASDTNEIPPEERTLDVPVLDTPSVATHAEPSAWIMIVVLRPLI